MRTQKQRILFWIPFVLFSGLYFFIKFQSPAITQALYQRGATQTLNAITFSKNSQTLDFYLGRANEALWGPLSEMIAGVLFLAFSLAYLRKSTAKIFGLAVFLYLLITKFDVLFFPVYGDAIGGPFAEAIWLAKNSFNYAGLYHQPSYDLGGPRVYLFSIYPGFLALLMKLIASVKAFLVVNHLIVFALGAGIAAMLRRTFLRLFDEKISLLASFVFLSLPLFHSQVEAINMEMPSVFFAMIAVSSLVEKKITKAALLAVVTTLVKETGVSICATVFLVGVVLFFLDEKKRFNLKVLGGSFLALAFALLTVFSKFLVSDQHVNRGLIHFLAGWPSLRWSVILILYGICFLVFLGWYVKDKVQTRKSWIAAFEFFLKEHYTGFVFFICSGMWFMLFINFYAVSPRYRLLLAPFLVFCAVFVFAKLVRKEAVVRGALTAIAVLFLSFSYGAFYKPLVTNDHVLLERSLEYRNDLKVYMRLAEEVEKKYSAYTIGAPFTVAQFLALPELGYVRKPLNVMIYAMRCTYGNIKNYRGLSNVDISRTVWVGVVAEVPPPSVYPVDPRDKILEEIVVGNKKATLFMGGLAIEKLWKMMVTLSSQGRLK